MASTCDKITLLCASQPFNFGNCCKAKCDTGLFVAEILNAINTSSVCKRGLRFPRVPTFNFWIGSIIFGEIKGISSLILPNAYKAFNNAAELAPNKDVVLPVKVVPSNKVIATAGSCVTSALSKAALTQALAVVSILA